MLPFYILLAIIGCSLADHEKYWSLSAKKVVGKRTVKNSLVKRDNEENFVSLKLIDENTFYMAEIEVGSNQQKVGVLVDTGSSDFWIVGSNNTLCKSGTTGPLSSNKGISLDFFLGQNSEENTMSSAQLHNKDTVSQIDCSQYGTFDESSSTSFKSNYTSFSISYDDNTFAKGTWGQDSISFGGLNIENANLAICDYTDNAQGVLGIGLAGLETTAMGIGRYTYENLPLKLVGDNIINKAAYSVFLDDSSNSEILFGAIDSSKYDGNLVSLPIVNALYGSNVPSPIQLTVTVNELKYISSSNSQVADIGNGAIAALLDTGTTLSYFPDSIVNSLIQLFGLSYSNTLGYYIADCSIGKDALLRFNFQGLELDIPFANFLINLYNQDNSVSDKCAFGILSSSNERYMTLGQSFLSSVYMVADLESMKIALAKGTNKGGSPKIDLITGEIPHAKQPELSSTYGARYDSFSVNSKPTLVSSNLATTSTSSSSSSLSSTTSLSSSTTVSSSSTTTSSSSSFSSDTESSLSSLSSTSTSATSSTSSSNSASSSKVTETSSSSTIVPSSTTSSFSPLSSSVSTSHSSSNKSIAKSSNTTSIKSSSTTESSSSTMTFSNSVASQSTVSSISTSKHKNDGSKQSTSTSAFALLCLFLAAF
ncbi:hypothetical protein CANINC_003338 [Pichia inconspicua]|uniref:candidapepsin n=1 Tax=Pichia inconspicua TaxID=52247 RepID=A0A4T0WZ26_9ASCO|nr:hypothetical protein CANINC_003338 [[Candida] inconspicua]